MTPRHVLTDAELAGLAVGRGDAATVRKLRAAQASRRKLMLLELLHAVSDRRLAEHWELLADAVRQAPETQDGVLDEPHFGAWLAHVLGRVRGAVTGSRPVRADLGYLGMVAAAAAGRAGIEFTVDVDVLDGGVVLPGLGRAAVDGTTATLSYLGGVTRIGSVVVPDDAAVDRDGWTALRRLRCSAEGLDLEVALNDLDPFRGDERHRPASRLVPEQVESWRQLLDEAWPMLVRHHRGYAEAIAEGLHTLVPLHSERADRGANATNVHSFGAVWLTQPATGLALAEGLLHEFQHAKLGALIDVVPLYERDDARLFYAAWRDDPRPVGSTLQGVYAFLGVTDFWRVQRNWLPDGQRRQAEAQFVRWREQVCRTQGQLETSLCFTATGRQVLAGMRAVLERWRDEPVATDAIDLAREASEDHWVSWRLRNERPVPDAVRRLADTWRAGRFCPAGEVPSSIQPALGEVLAISTRLDLARLRDSDPERFRRLTARPGLLAEVIPEASLADLLLAAGDNAAALDSYRLRIEAGEDDVAAWTGLALAAQRLALPELAALSDSPELCRAVHREVGAATDPLPLVRWLRPARSTSVVAPGRS